MSPTRALILLAVIATAMTSAAAEQHDILFDLTDEQYYSMPALFHLDDWAACVASRDTYCVGSFELSPEHTTHTHQLFDMMKRYSGNWVDNFNHTRLHRGYCLQRRCAGLAPPPPAPAAGATHPRFHQDELQTWFSTCVNATTTAAYNLSARLLTLEYCHSGRDEAPPLSLNQIAFVALMAGILALTAVSTLLEIVLSDHARKGAEWALSFSLQGSWRALLAPPPRATTDLRAFDGLRVLTMAIVIVEHVTWIVSHSYLSDTRKYEQLRRKLDVVLLANSTLMVQIFFTLSSFLLAHKLLEQKRKGEKLPPIRTFIETMINRIIRVSPSYFVVLWFAASWWERMGEGPLWEPMVHAEANICRRKWWTHLLFLNNVIYPQDKCLVQTWYLAADTQLYALGLVLTLALGRHGKVALGLLLSLGAMATALLFAMAYRWQLVPTLLVHRPELVRASYRGESSFDVLYQSPLANVAGALAGLLLAHLHHLLKEHHVELRRKQVFCWLSILAVPAATWWMACSPLLLGRGPPDRLAAAVLAAVERPVFVFLVSLALLGAINGVDSVVRRVLRWGGWALWARLSFGALLLHMPVNTALVAARLMPAQLDRLTVAVEWLGVAALSYLLALPLALLVELPAQRLQRALRPAARPRPDPHPPADVLKG